MASKGMISSRSFFEMMDNCAKGYQAETKKHYVWISFREKTYCTLPSGPHQRSGNYEIQIGHIRKAIRFLGIDPTCAKRHLPQLR